MKSNHKNFVHLVDSYTYCRMMHGAYNVGLNKCVSVAHWDVDIQRVAVSLRLRTPATPIFQCRGAQILQECVSHLKILGDRRVK